MRPLSLIVGLVFCLTGCGDGDTPKSGGANGSPSDALFVDVTESAGLRFTHDAGVTKRKYLPETMGSGGCALDFDGDGHLDLYLVQSGRVPGGAESGARPTNLLYRNRGDGTFEDVTDGSGTGHAGYGQGAVAGDFDSDGDPDLYVVNFGANVLLRNDGGGRFTDVTRTAGVGDSRWGSSAAFFDAEGDGDLDLYVVNYVDFSVEKHVDCGLLDRNEPAYCHPDVYPFSPDVFYRNRGDGTFEDATRASGLVDPDGKGLGVVVADLIGDDGRPDVYVANDSTPNFLFQNLGGGRFEEVGLFVGVSHNEDGATEAGMGVDAGDVDGDGRLDVIVTNLSMETNALYVRKGAVFSHATGAAGLVAPSLRPLGFGCHLFDADRDGDLDLFVTNGHVIDNIPVFNDALTWRQPSQLFWNDGSGKFTEVASTRMPDLARPGVGRGSLVLDYDDDGRLDLCVLQNRGPVRLFRNVATSEGHWIGFALRGTKPCNVGAVGAEVTLTAGGRKLRRVVKAGSSYQTSSDPRLHFGLGADEKARDVVIHWPVGDGNVERQELGELEADRYWNVTRGGAPEIR